MTTDSARAAASTEFLSQFYGMTRVLRSMGATVQRRIGANRTQVWLLNGIAHRGEARLADLAEDHQVDPSVISRQVSYLEREGLISRRPDPEDRRASLIQLTEAGEEMREKAIELYRQVLLQAVESWSTEEVQEAADVLRRIAQSHVAHPADGPVSA